MCVGGEKMMVPLCVAVSESYPLDTRCWQVPRSRMEGSYKQHVPALYHTTSSIQINPTTAMISPLCHSLPLDCNRNGNLSPYLGEVMEVPPSLPPSPHLSPGCGLNSCNPQWRVSALPHWRWLSVIAFSPPQGLCGQSLMNFPRST